MAVVEGRFRVMASDSQVIVTGGDESLVAVAHERLDRLERLWSRFIPTSDISRINLARGRPTVVDAETITLVATMVDAWRLTAGRYDPTVLPVLVANGYDRSIDDAERVTVTPSGALRVGGASGIAIDLASSTVAVPPSVTLDPGGIGKGLAADLTVSELLGAGARGALVSIGGDMAMSGEPPQPDGWYVTVERADRADGDVCTLAVSEGGAATSSTRSRRWTHDGWSHHHLVDPSVAAEATTDLAAVSVIAGRGWLAEAHATAALLAGSDRVLDYLRVNDITGLALTTTGGVLTSADLETLEVGASRNPS